MVEPQNIWFSQSETLFLMLSEVIERGFWMTIESAGAPRDHACFCNNVSHLAVMG
jgi:hypothetical protein